jgi:hypothetical protein
MDRLATTEECDLELIELGKALRLVSRRSRPVVMRRIDQVLDRRLILDRGGSAATRRTLLSS